MILSDKKLQVGDILITSQRNFVSHCGIVAKYSPPTDEKRFTNIGIIHATTGGMQEDDPVKWTHVRGSTDVFRYDWESSPFQSRKMKEKLTNVAYGLKQRCSYSKTRAFIKSWTGTSSYGPNAAERLSKYTFRYNNPNITTIANLYCSEFVILCYQIASMEGDTINSSSKYFINLDGKHSLPKDLRNWLLNRQGFWSMAGTLD